MMNDKQSMSIDARCRQEAGKAQQFNPRKGAGAPGGVS
jgi:hypothetical protein